MARRTQPSFSSTSRHSAKRTPFTPGPIDFSLRSSASLKTRYAIEWIPFACAAAPTYVEIDSVPTDGQTSNGTAGYAVPALYDIDPYAHRMIAIHYPRHIRTFGQLPCRRAKRTVVFVKLTAVWAGMKHDLAVLLGRADEPEGYFPAWDPTLPKGISSYRPRRRHWWKSSREG